MDRPHFRPRLTMLAPQPIEITRDVLRDRLKPRQAVFEYRIRDHNVLVWMAEGHRRFWSPALDTNLREHPRGTCVTGRFGPHPALMTATVFVSILLGFLMLLSMTWSYVQTTMGEPPHCLMGSAVAAVGLALVVVSGRLGAAWGRDQMHLLADLMEDLGELCDDEAALLQEAEAHRQAMLRAQRAATT